MKKLFNTNILEQYKIQELLEIINNCFGKKAHLHSCSEENIDGYLYDHINIQLAEYLDSNDMEVFINKMQSKYLLEHMYHKLVFSNQLLTVTFAVLGE